MSDLISRIADYFKNDYQGDDKTAPTMEITVNDLRYIANMNVDRCRAELELRNIKYNSKDCAGCIQCKTDEANALQEYIDKVVEELNELDVKAIKRYKGGTFGDYEGTDYYIKKSDAIKIVKQGGTRKEI